MEWRNQANHWEQAQFSYSESAEQHRVPLCPEITASPVEETHPARLAPIATIFMPGYEERPWLLPLPNRAARAPTQQESRWLDIGPNVVEVEGSVPTPASEICEQSIPSETLPEPIKATFEFVSIHGPTGKRDTSAQARVRAHAMRRVHQQRRATTVRPLAHTTGRLQKQQQQPAQSCACTEALATKLVAGRIPMSDQASDQRRLDISPSPSRGFVLIAHVDTPVSPGYSSPYLVTGLPVNCRQCGKVQLSTPTDPNDAGVLRAPIAAGPRGIINPGMLDPFATAPLSITHRMHELLHHCERKHSTSVRILD